MVKEEVEGENTLVEEDNEGFNPVEPDELFDGLTSAE